MTEHRNDPAFRMMQRLFVAYTQWNVGSRADRSVSVNEDLVLLHLVTGPVTSADLCRRIGVTSASMTHIVAGLEARGLLKRVPDPSDGRRILLYASKATLAHLDGTADGRELTDLFDRFSEGEQRTITAFLEGAIEEFEQPRA